MRTISPELDEALLQGIARPVYLVEFDHPTEGALRLWSGVGIVRYAGNSYTGAGALLSVSAIQDSTELQVTQVTFNLMLPDADDAIANIIAAPVSKIPVTLWEAFLDLDNNVIGTPFIRFSGKGDPPHINDNVDPAASTITRIASMTVYGAINNLTTPLRTQLSNEEQVAVYPDDTGLSQMAQTPQQQLIWAPGSYNSFSPPP